MSLDAKLWDALQDHGVTQEHLELLLSLLELQRSGHWHWHIVRGQIDHTDMHVQLPQRSRELGRVRAELMPTLARQRRA